MMNVGYQKDFNEIGPRDQRWVYEKIRTLKNKLGLGHQEAFSTAMGKFKNAETSYSPV